MADTQESGQLAIELLWLTRLFCLQISFFQRLPVEQTQKWIVFSNKDIMYYLPSQRIVELVNL
jgi:hypothetical protein